MATTLYVSYGSEPFFIARDLAKGRKSVGRVVYDLDCSELSEAEILSYIERPHIEGAPRVIILDKADFIKGGKDLKSYFTSRTIGAEPLMYVGVYSDRLSDLWALASSRGKLVEHKKLKTWGDPNEIVRWLTKEASSLGRVLAEKDAAVLYELVGPDLFKLHMELQKLQLLGVVNSKVTEEHIRTVVDYVAPVLIDQIINAIFMRKRDDALKLFNRYVSQNGEDSLLLMLSVLMTHVRKLAFICLLSEKGLKLDDIASAADIPPWRFKQQYKDILAHHKSRDVIGWMDRLRALEVTIKGSGLAKRTQLELLVCDMSCERLPFMFPIGW